MGDSSAAGTGTHGNGSRGQERFRANSVPALGGSRVVERRVIDTYIHRIAVWPQKIVVYFKIFHGSHSTSTATEQQKRHKKEDRAGTRSSDFAQPIKVLTQKLADDFGGEGGSRTHAPFNRPNAFRVHPLGPLEYFSVYVNSGFPKSKAYSVLLEFPLELSGATSLLNPGNPHNHRLCQPFASQIIASFRVVLVTTTSILLHICYPREQTPFLGENSGEN